MITAKYQNVYLYHVNTKKYLCKPELFISFGIFYRNSTIPNLQSTGTNTLCSQYPNVCITKLIHFYNLDIT